MVLVVVLGSILIYLVANKNKKTDSGGTSTGGTGTSNSTGTTQSSYVKYDVHDAEAFVGGPADNTEDKPSTSYKVKYENDLKLAHQLDGTIRDSVPILRTAQKITEDINIVGFPVNASKIIFSLYGNLKVSHKNNVFVYDNLGSLVFKLALFPDVNKVVINDWYESENVFAGAWPKTIAVSLNQYHIRLNNVLVYEFPRNEGLKLFRYIELDTRGIKDLQLLSINDQDITAEEVIKKD